MCWETPEPLRTPYLGCRGSIKTNSTTHNSLPLTTSRSTIWLMIPPTPRWECLVTNSKLHRIVTKPSKMIFEFSVNPISFQGWWVYAQHVIEWKFQEDPNRSLKCLASYPTQGTQHDYLINAWGLVIGPPDTYMTVITTIHHFIWNHYKKIPVPTKRTV